MLCSYKIFFFRFILTRLIQDLLFYKVGDGSIRHWLFSLQEIENCFFFVILTFLKVVIMNKIMNNLWFCVLIFFHFSNDDD